MIRESKGMRKFEFDKPSDSTVSEKSSEHEEEEDDILSTTHKQPETKLELFLNRALGMKISKKKLKIQQKERMGDMKAAMIEQGTLPPIHDTGVSDGDNTGGKVKVFEPLAQPLVRPLGAFHIECCDLSAWYEPYNHI